MMKVMIVLLSSFWLSCGNTPRTAQNTAPTSEEKVAPPQTGSTDSILSSNQEQEKEHISVSEPEPQNVEETFESKETLDQEEEISKPEEVVRETPREVEKVAMRPDHSQWNALLLKYVNDKGDVDYKSFQNDINSLERYLKYLAENSPKKDWSKNEKLAYYINLYNAATVKLILDNYPTSSIKDIKNPWGKDWVETGDGLLSLGDIEHKILRKMNEPRIHFAINCASYSCPKLLNQAFTASQMEKQLNDVTFNFINDKTRNTISNEKLSLSNIFKWYKKDFTENGSLIDYIKPYTKVDINTSTDIDYLKYDWNLNEAK